MTRIKSASNAGIDLSDYLSLTSGDAFMSISRSGPNITMGSSQQTTALNFQEEVVILSSFVPANIRDPWDRRMSAQSLENLFMKMLSRWWGDVTDYMTIIYSYSTQRNVSTLQSHLCSRTHMSCKTHSTWKNNIRPRQKRNHTNTNFCKSDADKILEMKKQESFMYITALVWSN